MSSVIKDLHAKGLIKPPPFVVGGIQYETIMGSEAYGVSTDSSDRDIYGFCMPPKEVVFPHLAGEIHGFGRQIQRFEQYQEHHIFDTKATRAQAAAAPAAGGNMQKPESYDVSIYNIVKYFQLCMECNPNMIDSLFTPRRCVVFCTPLSDRVREQRKLFLHKGAWHKFKGYAFSQMKKIRVKDPDEGSKRREMVDKFGYDVKFAYHVIRLMDEVEQIMTEGDLSLDRNSEQLKSIRRGEWTLTQIEEHFAMKERTLEEVYSKSTLRYSPDEPTVKGLLLECLEAHYGDLTTAVRVTGKDEQALTEIRAMLTRAGY